MQIFLPPNWSVFPSSPKMFHAMLQNFVPVFKIELHFRTTTATFCPHQLTYIIYTFFTVPVIVLNIFTSNFAIFDYSFQILLSIRQGSPVYCYDT